MAVHNLLVDIGNTRIKWVIGDANGLGPLRAAPHADLMPTVIAMALPPVTHAFVASVGPEALTRQVCAGLQASGVKVQRVQAGRAGCGVRNGYLEPERLGVDRWLALVGARQLGRTAALVVGAGTALTADILDAQGQHQGGLLAPGLHLLYRTLSAAVTALPARLAAWDGATLPAQATEPALARGAGACALGFVERLYADASTQHTPLRLVLHGGDAEVLQRGLRLPCQVVPDLVLRGLVSWVEEVGCVD